MGTNEIKPATETANCGNCQHFDTEFSECCVFGDKTSTANYCNDHEPSEFVKSNITDEYQKGKTCLDIPSPIVKCKQL